MKIDLPLEAKDVGGNHQAGAQCTPRGIQLREFAQAGLPRAEMQADFLLGLAARRGQSVAVLCFHAAAGKRHLPRPGVALAPRTANHQHPEFAFTQLQDQRHRRALHERAQPLARWPVFAQAGFGDLQQGDGHGRLQAGYF